MGTFTRDNTELAVDIDGAGQQHRAEAGGMTIALERWNAGLDTAEWFADLPGGACQEPHWGYCLKGTVTMRYTDGQTEVISAGRGLLHPARPQRPHRRRRRVRRVHPGRPDPRHQHRRAGGERSPMSRGGHDHRRPRGAPGREERQSVHREGAAVYVLPHRMSLVHREPRPPPSQVPARGRCCDDQPGCLPSDQRARSSTSRVRSGEIRCEEMSFGQPSTSSVAQSAQSATSL